MITFACKEIKESEIIRCSFSLNKTEYNVLMFMLENKQFLTTSQIAKNMKLERTTIQKAVKNLSDKNLVKKIQRNLPQGSYIFLYQVKNKNEIKSRMKAIIYEWYKNVEKKIDNL